MTAIFRNLFGRQGGQETYDYYNPQQKNILNRLRDQIGDILPQYLGDIGSDFDTFAAPALRDYRQKVLPELENRYAQLLGSNYEQSSGFPLALGSSARELTENLASKRIGMRNEQLGILQQLLTTALNPDSYPYYRPREGGIAESLVTAAVKGVFGT